MAPAAAAARPGSIRREAEAPIDGGAELGLAVLLGIVSCSMAITLAAREPPPVLHKNAYFVALIGAFFAGMAGVITGAVCVSNNPRAHRAAGRKLMRAAVGPLAVVVAGLSAASLLY